MRSRGLVFILIMGFLASCAHAPKPPDGITKPIPVTVEELVENPVKFHGKRVRVKAFLALTRGFKKTCVPMLFPSIPDYLAFNAFDAGLEYDFPAIEIEIEQETVQWPFSRCGKDFSPHYVYQRTSVEIVGEYDGRCNTDFQDEEGKFWMCLHHWSGGDLTNISSVEVLEWPIIPSQLLKYLQVFDPEESSSKTYFEVDEVSADAKSALVFLKKWRDLVRTKDAEKLLASYASELKEFASEEFQNPESIGSKYLFQDNYFVQDILAGAFNSDPVVLRHFVANDEGSEIDLKGCFCRDNSCEKNGLWPPTLNQMELQSFYDDFICIGLSKKGKNWEWYF